MLWKRLLIYVWLFWISLFVAAMCFKWFGCTWNAAPPATTGIVWEKKQYKRSEKVNRTWLSQRKMIQIHKVMNRLAVYSYLTRYPYGHSGSDRLFTVPLPDSNVSVKMISHEAFMAKLNCQQNWSITFSGQGWTNGHMDKQDRLSKIWRRAVNSPSQIIRPRSKTWQGPLFASGHVHLLVINNGRSHTANIIVLAHWISTLRDRYI